MNWQIEEMQPAYRSDLQTLYLQSRIHVFTWLDTSGYSLYDFDLATLNETILVAVTKKKASRIYIVVGT